MRTIAMLVLLAAPLGAEETWTEFTQRFKKEWQAGDAASRKTAVEGIAAFDTPEAVALCEGIWQEQSKRLAFLETEKWRIREEMAKYPLVIKNGQPVNKDWWEKRKALDAEAKKVEASARGEREVRIAAVGVIVSRAADAAIAKAVDLLAKSTDDDLRAAIARAAEAAPEAWIPALVDRAGADKDPVVRASAIGALGARRADAALHTIAVGEDAADKFMKGLADDNGGQFVKR